MNVEVLLVKITKMFVHMSIVTTLMVFVKENEDSGISRRIWISAAVPLIHGLREQCQNRFKVTTIGHIKRIR